MMTVKAVSAAVMAVLMLALTFGLATAAEISNQSTPLPQPVGATRFYTQHELQQGLRYRILVAKQNGSIEAALDPSRIDTLEFSGGGDSGAGGGAGDSGAGSAGSSGGDAGGGSGGK